MVSVDCNRGAADTLVWMDDWRTAGVATRQVGWTGRPWCGFAGTICLFGFCRKHHGAHVRPPPSTSARSRGQRNRRRHVSLDTAGKHFDYSGISHVDYSSSTDFVGTTTPTRMGRTVLQDAGRPAARHGQQSSRTNQTSGVTLCWVRRLAPRSASCKRRPQDA